MDVFQLEMWLVMTNLGALHILLAGLFKHLHYFRTFVPCPPSPTSSPSFLIYFSAILVILCLVLLSLACGVLCSPFCRSPRSLFNFITIFSSIFPLIQGYCVSLFCFRALPYCLSISFFLCKKKKWKSMSCNPLLYFSNENPTREPSHVVFVFHKTTKWESARFRGSTQVNYSLALSENEW